jgi:hypothetical protein
MRPSGRRDLIRSRRSLGAHDHHGSGGRSRPARAKHQVASAGKPVGPCSTLTPILPHPLLLAGAASFLLFEPALSCGHRRLRLFADRSGSQCIVHQLLQAFGRRPTVRLLTTVPLRNNVQNTILVNTCGKSAEDLLLLLLGQARRAGHVEEHRHPRIELIDVLAARTAAARSFENKLALGNQNLFGSIHRHRPAQPRSLADHTCRASYLERAFMTSWFARRSPPGKGTAKQQTRISTTLRAKRLWCSEPALSNIFAVDTRVLLSYTSLCGEV